MSCIDRYDCPIHWFTHPDCPVRPFRWQRDWKQEGLLCPRPELRQNAKANPDSPFSDDSPRSGRP